MQVYNPRCLSYSFLKSPVLGIETKGSRTGGKHATIKVFFSPFYFLFWGLTELPTQYQPSTCNSPSLACGVTFCLWEELIVLLTVFQCLLLITRIKSKFSNISSIFSAFLWSHSFQSSTHSLSLEFQAHWFFSRPHKCQTCYCFSRIPSIATLLSFMS